MELKHEKRLIYKKEKGSTNRKVNKYNIQTPSVFI